MTARFQRIAFTPSVKQAQAANGSRAAYARREGELAEPDRLTENEAAFIATRDSFYLATVSETGWPYVQHRGGPPGFVKLLGDRLLGIADYRGNRQYVTLGNLAYDSRAALFFMDYPRRARLKLYARVRRVDLAQDQGLAAALVDRAHRATVERGLLFDVEAFDWNCSQHITPRFTAEDIASGVRQLRERIAELEAEVARLSGAAPALPGQ
jgi:predicted pyridoxine 5'-phosphate oxidase superfamily flavin-nucleotide-binding protein